MSLSRESGGVSLGDTDMEASKVTEEVGCFEFPVDVLQTLLYQSVNLPTYHSKSFVPYQIS